MQLRYFTETFHDTLFKDVNRNIERYASIDRAWIDALLVENPRGERDTGITVGQLPKLIISGKAADDAENAVRLYAAMPDLTPVQAMDGRLWAQLCHGPFWEYVVVRWGASNPSVTRSRFFLRGGGIGALSLNGLSRLWWTGRLTFDKKAKDPYALTRFMLDKQDIHTGLLQRNMGKCPTIRAATIKFCANNAERIVKAGGWSPVVQRLVKDLNAAGGVYVLDALQEPQVCEILDESLKGAEP